MSYGENLKRYSNIYMCLGASNHTDKERQIDDYYATSPIAIDKLLTVETLNKNIWECAVGGGDLACRLNDFGYNVYSTDIVDRGYSDFDGIQDFLTADKLPFGSCDILTNPPYKNATEFVLKALELLKTGDKCYMFLKLTFLEGKARYKELFSKYPPKVIYVFSERVLCAKNGEFDYMKAHGGSAIAYGWYVWEKGRKGETKIKWI